MLAVALWHRPIKKKDLKVPWKGLRSGVLIEKWGANQKSIKIGFKSIVHGIFTTF